MLRLLYDDNCNSSYNPLCCTINASSNKIEDLSIKNENDNSLEMSKLDYKLNYPKYKWKLIIVIYQY